jgi:hypothetical protein
MAGRLQSLSSVNDSAGSWSCDFTSAPKCDPAVIRAPACAPSHSDFGSGAPEFEPGALTVPNSETSRSEMAERIDFCSKSSRSLTPTWRFRRFLLGNYLLHESRPPAPKAVSPDDVSCGAELICEQANAPSQALGVVEQGSAQSSTSTPTVVRSPSVASARTRRRFLRPRLRDGLDRLPRSL